MSATGNTNSRLTSEEYKAIGGVRCPACGSSDIEGAPFETEAGVAMQEVGCLACGSEWTDHYELSGYTYVIRRAGGGQ